MTAAGAAGKPLAVFVAGPTCSGKSALALALALRLDGVVINADSMQVYRELRVLTARPPPEDEALVPHALYGVRPAALAGNAAWWRGEALAAMEAAREAGRVPILCGGSGLYFAALTEGFAPIDDPGEAARAEARALLLALGPAGLHARLAVVDPETAAELRPTDSQRLARAWEVVSGTGRGLAAWRRCQEEADFPWTTRAVLLDPPRDELRRAIAGRLEKMLAAGVLDEVAALLAQNLDPALPAMRAHGVPEFSAHLRGTLPLGDACRRVALVTGQYTKRQATWFRHRGIAAQADTHRLNARIGSCAQFIERILPNLVSFIHKTG